MSARSKRTALWATGLVAAGLVIMPASAQDGAQPRDVPEGFVVPGPAPTNAPDSPALAPGAQPQEIPEGFVVPGPPPTNAPEAGAADQAPPAAANPMSFAIAPHEGTTDWPCVQRRVETLTPAQLWAGPDLALADGVQRTPEMRRLVGTVIARRLPLAEAEATVADFVASLPEANREATATALFEDLLAALNAERSQVMEGIERYGAKQKELATRLREENASFFAMQREEGADAAAVEEARQALVWDTRIFNERRSSLTYVCEVPTMIEQRAFALGRAISRAL
ncbi:hypothetical protein [Aurantimonas endophytica]|uniref:CRP-like cAMP-binding protein n=1 Tax=Aurantimonas endophytica TaxID=1522175 RepID=A0A7W6MPX1_9HYPH|nr:hypothetical protein [Aurantimonas endophytica]MBB4003363.1 CRP-like cAMP-binding protein [Aurantimonas endophytica]MCO6404224.1 hypothetical protein [Aurantimonas endophytica]